MDKEIKDTKEVRDSKDGQKPFRPRKKKKVCFFCAEKIEHIDYKNVGSFRKNLSEHLPLKKRKTAAEHLQQFFYAHYREREANRPKWSEGYCSSTRSRMTRKARG